MNEFCCFKHCWGVCEQNAIVNSVHVDEWTAEWGIITSNGTCFSQPFVFLQNVLGLTGSLAGYLLFIGQTADAACTPLVGYFSDKSSGCYKFGRRKCWHAFGKCTHKSNQVAKIMATCLSNDQSPYYFSPHFEPNSWLIDNIDTKNISEGMQRR